MTALHYWPLPICCERSHTFSGPGTPPTIYYALRHSPNAPEAIPDLKAGENRPETSVEELEVTRPGGIIS